MNVELSVGKLLPYRSPQADRAWTALIGMIIFLGSWAMMFAALFFVYGGVRAKAAVWPPIDLPPLPVVRGALNTLVVLLSSGAFHVSVRSYRLGKPALAPWGLLVAVLLGALFLALQVDSWLELYTLGLHPSSGTFGSSFYGLTWLHAAHVAIGVLAVLVLCVRAFTGHYTPARYLGVRLWSLYWHFVGVVWFIMFVTVYLA